MRLTFFPDGMSPELVAQRGQHARGKILFIPADETHLQRQCDHGSGHVQVDRFEYGPSAFARIGHPGLDSLQLAIFVQGTGSQVRLSNAELAALLEGIDLSRARRLPRWNPPETGVKAM